MTNFDYEPLSTAEKHLLKLLANASTFLTANMLAQALSKSNKTIRNMVKRINTKAEVPVIFSSHKGYRLNHSINFVEKKLDRKKQLPEQRLYYLLQQLIQAENLDYYALAETLFISIPTIEKDILRLRIYLKNYNVSLIKKQEKIRLVGAEQAIRQAVCSFIQKQALQSLQAYQALQDFFPHLPISKFEVVLNKVFQAEKVHVNGYVLPNLLIYLLVTAQRIQKKCFIEPSESLSTSSKKQVAYQLAQEIFTYISDFIPVEFPENEVFYLTALIQPKIITEEQLLENSLTSQPIYQTMKQILAETAEKFALEPFSKAITSRLSIYVENLKQRLYFEDQVDYLLTDSLRQTDAFIYELALFIANKIEKVFKLDLSKMEQALIALQLGNFFSEQKKEETKLNCILFIPTYYNQSQHLIAKLKKYFDPKLKMDICTDLLTTETLSNMQKVDLVISTLSIPEIKNLVQISPFLTEQDNQKIEQKIWAIKKQQSSQFLKTMYQELFTIEHFSQEVYLANPQEYIHYLGKNLLAENIVSIDFSKKVEKREKIDTTAYGCIAIPHAITNDVKKSSISWIINQKPICWNSELVQVIVLPTFKPEDLKAFQLFFNYFVVFFSDPQKKQLLTQVKNYADFQQLLWHSSHD